MTLTIQEAIARVPQWEGQKIKKISSLGGGITNLNYKVDVGGESFVVRITGAKTELLGIDRKNEHIANVLAGELGIAPEVVYFIQPEGYLVTRFLDSRPLPPEEITTPGRIKQLASILKRIHALPPIPGQFDAFKVVREYTQTVKNYQVKLPDDFEWMIDLSGQAHQSLLKHPYTPATCHNDLLNANFLFDGNIRLLDWEYAGMGDVFFDLANFAAHHQLTDGQEDWLLQCYFGQSDPERRARLKIMKVMSDFREAMWAMVQVAVSKLDFDFQEYADKHFARIRENMKRSAWEQWIKEA